MVVYLCVARNLSRSGSLALTHPPTTPLAHWVLLTATWTVGGQRRQIARKPAKKKLLIAPQEVHRFMMDCFGTMQVPAEHARAMADMLMAADYQGHVAHGMNRMVMYMYDLCRKACDGAAEPRIVKESPATALVDGRSALGAVTGNFCMDLAVGKAKHTGVGWVCCRNSNHYGCAGWYAMRAIRHGLVGITMSNGSPLVAPTGSRVPTMGTNPIGFGVPAGTTGDDYLLLDMATSRTTLGQVEIIRLEGGPLPAGSAIGADGRVCRDAEAVYTSGSLLPWAGLAEASGAKASGIGCLVDILSGVLSGANFLRNVRLWHKVATDSKPANVGQVFVAVDAQFFDDDFAAHMQDFLKTLRSCQPVDPRCPVLVPGDKERRCMRKVDELGGIEYPVELLEIFEVLARRLRIPKMKIFETCANVAEAKETE